MSYAAIKRRAKQLSPRKGTALPYELDILRRYYPEEGEAVRLRLDRSIAWIHAHARELGLSHKRVERVAPNCDGAIDSVLRRMPV